MKRILIMEDNIALAMEWASTFELNGYDVLLTTNVKEAISFLQSQPIDLLVTDLFVEEKEGGLHLIRALNKTANSKIPSIAVTGARIPNSKSGDRSVFLETARLLGATSSIQKPFPAAELILLAEDLLRKQG